MKAEEVLQWLRDEERRYRLAAVRAELREAEVKNVGHAGEARRCTQRADMCKRASQIVASALRQPTTSS